MTTAPQVTSPVHIVGYEFSNFVRTLMLICEELDIQYTVGFSYQGKEIAFKGEEHLNLHPYGKFPILVDGEFSLTETASIGRYLAKKFSNSQSLQLSQENCAKHDAFCAIASNYIDKAIIRDYLLEFAFPKGEEGAVRFDVAEKMKGAVVDALQIIETTLTEEEFLNNEQPSLADALLAPMLHYLSTLPDDYNLLLAYPTVNEYLSHLMTRTTCQKILVANKLNG
jgi:glutathione S-transferase